jgi:cellulose synthase/poly-beta-1,6-N-acetylglucosamine synthase-like glycosyltransferase
MSPALAAITIALLIAWPVYNLGMALLAARPTRGPARVTEPVPLHFWIMIPALNEAAVIGHTVSAALALETPLTPVRVLVVDDGSDDATPDILAAIDDPRLHVLHREHPNARQGKGEALNAGYREILQLAAAAGETISTVVGIIDGDGRGDSRLLTRIAPLFADRHVGAVQCRVRIHNRRRILGLLQDIEFACIANASQSLRDRLDSVGMGGNGQFTRLTELVRLGVSPWSACLVEDMELGLRLHLDGISIRYCSTAVITQQAVVDVRRLLRQRTRWAQGNLQCARYLRGLTGSRHIGSVGLLDFLIYLVAPWLTVPLSVLVAAGAATIVAGLVTGQTFGGLSAAGDGPLPVAVWLGVMLLPGLIWGMWHRWQLGDEPLYRCLLAGLCYPMFLLLGVAATWRAVARQVTGRNSWAKTDRVVEEAAPAAVPVARMPMDGVVVSRST